MIDQAILAELEERQKALRAEMDALMDAEIDRCLAEEKARDLGQLHLQFRGINYWLVGGQWPSPEPEPQPDHVVAR